MRFYFVLSVLLTLMLSGCFSTDKYDRQHYENHIPGCPEAGYSEWSVLVPGEKEAIIAGEVFQEKGWENIRKERYGKHAWGYAVANCVLKENLH